MADERAKRSGFQKAVKPPRAEDRPAGLPRAAQGERTDLVTWRCPECGAEMSGMVHHGDEPEAELICKNDHSTVVDLATANAIIAGTWSEPVEATGRITDTSADLTADQFVERVMWGIHASRGHGSPRALWAAMPTDDRAKLREEAQGAIVAYTAHAGRAEHTAERALDRIRSLDADDYSPQEAAAALEQALHIAHTHRTGG